ncbi:MAG TPA: tRNA uridine-5-carboxymethylaminomethyl(34) synthesis GTPase MnmE [Allosphingosinicella sp.]|nr:tRNA uridine-5-carboxymethylaminomethyl(34) synthesis GTPase MnmE [Allosphingosinicella sp.]
MKGDTIYALSSGAPPAALAVIRISGPRADAALHHICRRVPEARRPALVELREGDILLDRAIVVRFPGPKSATGEDVVELHLHGGRAVVAVALGALSRIEGLRQAEPGEFTRRAFETGRLDLAEAEGLADLLAAETEAQRRAALGAAQGALSRLVETWRGQILGLSAALEARLDFSDEGEVGEGWPAGWHEAREELAAEIRQFLQRPSSQRLRDGVRVVIAGPPNAGKSSLLNCLAGREAAITAPTPGTTRDVIEVPLSLLGRPFVFTDTAGLRESGDGVEQEGVARATARVADADIVLWLGAPGESPASAPSIDVASKCDLGAVQPGGLPVSSLTGEGMDRLVDAVVTTADTLLPRADEVTANERQRGALAEALAALDEDGSDDLLIAAEALRSARAAVDRITGRAGVEDVLDDLFARFCIGK